MRIVALLLLLCLLSAQAWATDRYTTPGGATSGTCAVGAPCTLLRVTSAAQSGDTVYIGAGTYSEGINTGSANVTYTCPSAPALPDSTAPTFFSLMKEWHSTCIINGLASGTTGRTIKVDVNGIKIEKLTVMTPALAGTEHKYGITIENAVTGAIIQDNEVTSDGTSDPSDLTYNQWGIMARGTGFAVRRNSVHYVQIGININTDVGIPTGTVSYNVLSDFSIGDEEDADCISIGSTARDMSFGLIIERNDCQGFRDDGLDMLSSSNTIARYNYIHGSAESTTANSGIKAGRETSSGNQIYGNFIDARAGNSTGTYCMVIPGLSSGLISSNIMITDANQTCVEMSEWTVTPFGGGDNNTFANNVMRGGIPFFNRNNATGNALKNNILIGTTADVKVDTGMTVTGTTNDLARTGTATGGGTYTGTGDLAVTPNFTGGTTPTTLQGFRLLPTSPLKCAGTSVGRLTDALGRGFEPDCTPIGAMVYGRGDPRTTALSPRP